jgi:hypothetical protein
MEEMRVTKHMSKLRAINLCKLMWEKIELSGMNKEDWLELHPEVKFGEYGCSLCLWVDQGGSFDGGQEVDDRVWCGGMKRICPLIQQYGKSCIQLGYQDYESNADFYKAVRELK